MQPSNKAGIGNSNLGTENPDDAGILDPNIAGNEGTDNSEGTANAEPDDSAKPAAEPNIIFVGDGEPMTKINNGMETIRLPKAEEQVNFVMVASEKENDDTETKENTGIPFFHKKAGTIIQLFPDQYKRFVKKGE